MDNFDLKKYLTEGRLLKEDIDREIVSYIADTYIQNAKGGDRRYADFLDLNIRDAVQDVLGILQSSGHPLHDETKEEYSIVKRDKAKGIFETEGRSLKEGIPQESEIADYVTAMYDDSVVEKEGFQSDIWTKEEYTSPTRDGASIFIALMKHLNSVGGKDVLEGNPDIHLELLPNGDIKWSADVRF